MATFSKNRGIVRTFLPEVIKTGLSATKALRFFQGQGLGVRKTDFLSDWREIGGFEKKKEIFKYIPKKYKPTAATISETSDMLSKKYSYIVEVVGKDSITGQPKTAQWRVATDDLITLAEAEEEVAYQVEVAEYVAEIEDYTISAVECRKTVTL